MMKDSINTGFNLRGSVEQTPFEGSTLPAKCRGKTTRTISWRYQQYRRNHDFSFKILQPDWILLSVIMTYICIYRFFAIWLDEQSMDPYIVYTTNWMKTVTWLNMDCCMATFRASEYVNSTSGSNNFSCCGSADPSRKCENIQGKNPCTVFRLL